MSRVPSSPLMEPCSRRSVGQTERGPPRHEVVRACSVRNRFVQLRVPSRVSMSLDSVGDSCCSLNASFVIGCTGGVPLHNYCAVRPIQLPNKRLAFSGSFNSFAQTLSRLRESRLYVALTVNPQCRRPASGSRPVVDRSTTGSNFMGRNRICRRESNRDRVGAPPVVIADLSRN